MSLTNTPNDETVDLQQNHQKVSIADYKLTSSQAILVTYGLGSCLGISIFDSEKEIAGLIHIKRPSRTDANQTNSAAFADSGIELLVEQMENEGASTGEMKAKVAGGSDICGFTFSEDGSSIGERNIKQAEETLADCGIPVVNRDVGGEHSRTLRLDGGSGILTIESESKTTRMI